MTIHLQGHALNPMCPLYARRHCRPQVMYCTELPGGSTGDGAGRVKVAPRDGAADGLIVDAFIGGCLRRTHEIAWHRQSASLLGTAQTYCNKECPTCVLFVVIAVVNGAHEALGRPPPRCALQRPGRPHAATPAASVPRTCARIQSRCDRK